MEVLVYDRLLLRQSIFSLSSRLCSAKTPNVSYSFRRGWCSKRNTVAVYCSSPASPDSDASIYGGWEEMELPEENDDSGKLQQFRGFLLSLGIDDKKHALPFLLGLFAALAVSRVRFSTITLLPISVLVFFGGYITGTAHVGTAGKRLGRNGGALGVFDVKLKELEALFSDLDGKMAFLRKEFEGRIITDEVGMEATEGYLQIVEHTKVAINQAQKTLRESLNEDFLTGLMEFDFGSNKTNQKPSRKRADLNPSDIDFFQFLTGMLHESLTGSKETKSKHTIREKLAQPSNQVGGLNSESLVSGRGILEPNEPGNPSKSQFRHLDQKNSKVKECGMPSYDKQRRTKTKIPGKEDSFNNGCGNGELVTNDATTRAKYDFRKSRLGNSMLSFHEELDDQRRSLHFTSGHGSSEEMVYEQNFEFSSHLHDSDGGNTPPKGSKSMEHLTREFISSSIDDHGLEIKDVICEPSHPSESRKHKDQHINAFNLGEDATVSENHPSSGNGQPTHANGEDNMPYSSNTPIDEPFEYKLTEAANLIKFARDYMSQANEEKADAMLYKAAGLLSAAVVMRPMSLIAVGQLGNTYLLHGELKLKVSQELRTLLSKTDTMFSGKSSGLRFKKVHCMAMNKENIASALVSVCEECEGLLVEAGRRYRRALSIDGNDIRALYNWGLALCFRAQLIADVGPEAAMDADKLYLAAIDKFNAMMSRSNTHAPDALYRWGVALQQRSRLRLTNSREKSRLLHQAKSLFQDALSMESGNQLVRNALVSCLSELNYNNQL
ncbi:hypothetical protein HPP92_014364 [Vanilla planifolia]|uniref:Uncharacterized protein n=1 Tax=Vanilla planifolia TaxID=51239 RepID=A0A835QUA6_VANPL|nr:hypothetical protein HPP92_014364 [Vanilla planifolia]